MFSYRLKQLRENASLTQYELAKKLNLTQSTIAYYESGKKMPTLENAKIIAELFNISLDYLLGLSDIQNKESIKKQNKIDSSSDEISKEIRNLSPESQEELKKLIELYKLKDMQKRNSDIEIADDLTSTE